MLGKDRGAAWRRVVVPSVLLAALLAVLVAGAGVAFADDPGRTVDYSFLGVPGAALPGSATVTVHGDGWSGEGGVRLWQCADVPEDEEQFWYACDQSTEVSVDVDPPWVVEMPVQDVIETNIIGEWGGFPPGTVNHIGNGTWDCQASGSCVIFATEGDLSAGESSAWTTISFEPFTPALDASDHVARVVPSSTVLTNLTNGAPVTVESVGHRPGTQAMTYACPETGWAFPGACDPIAGSQAEVDAAGVYSSAVALPRFILIDDPWWEPGDPESWWDCVGGCSLVVASADDLASAFWRDGIDPTITFRDVPLEQNPQLFSVTAVKVNKAGGITVQGLVDCSTAATAWGVGGAQVGGNVAWTARQPIGRKGVVTAHYESAILSLCNASDGDPRTPPFVWRTHPPITSSATWWVYPSSGGKFVTGAIHVDAQITGGVLTTSPFEPSPNAGAYMLTGAVQYDGKAIKG